MLCYDLLNSAIVPFYALSSELVKRKVSGIALGITNEYNQFSTCFYFIALVFHHVFYFNFLYSRNLLPRFIILFTRV